MHRGDVGHLELERAGGLLAELALALVQVGRDHVRDLAQHGATVAGAVDAAQRREEDDVRRVADREPGEVARRDREAHEARRVQIGLVREHRDLGERRARSRAPRPRA